MKNKLLVEGNDDLHIIYNICDKKKIEKNFEIVDCKGIVNLLNQILVRLKESDLKTLGIIVDADTNLHSIWDKISDVLTKHQYNPPTEFPEHGLIINSDESPKIGVWIMPNNNLNGKIEDFITYLIPADDALLPVAETILQQIEKDGKTLYKRADLSKARISTWLAWQKDPGVPMGRAIAYNYLNTNDENCNKFTKWLCDLYK
jgi:hypothetical protein